MPDRSKPRNITLDVDTQEALLEFQAELEAKLGFKPSLPQTLQYVLRTAKNNFADDQRLVRDEQ